MLAIIVIFFIWLAIAEFVKWCNAEEAKENKSVKPSCHLVPYSVEWGGTYYRKCYCDGSVCGTIPVQPR